MSVTLLAADVPANDVGAAVKVVTVPATEYGVLPAEVTAESWKSYAVAYARPVTVILVEDDTVCENVVHVPDGEVRY